jgi:hypothetical protein
MAWQIAARWRETHPLGPGVDGPILSDESPEYQYLTSNARYLWPPLRSNDDPPKPLFWASTRGFVAVVANLLRGIVFNVALLLALLFVVARPIGWWMTNRARVAADGSYQRPELAWQIVAAAVQGALIAVFLTPAFRQWWSRMSAGGERRRHFLVVVFSVAVSTLSVWLILTVDNRLRIHGLSLVIAAVMVVATLVWSAMPGESSVPDRRRSLAVGACLAGALTVTLGHWPVFVRMIALAASVAIGIVGSRGSAGNSTARRRAAALVLLLGVGGVVSAWVGKGRTEMPFGWLMIWIGLVAAALWALRSKNRSGASGFMLAFVALGVGKLWLDNGFRSFEGSRRVRLVEITVIIRVAIALVVFLGVLAIARVVVTRTKRSSSIAASVLIAVLPGLCVSLWVATATWCGRWVYIVLLWLLVLAASVSPWILKAKTAAGRSLVGPWANTCRLIAGVFAAALAMVGTCLYVWRFHVATRMPIVDEVWRWVAIAGAVALVYVFLDQKWWSPHQMYKRHLGTAFSPIRGNPGVAATALPDRVRTRLPEWAVKPARGPQLLVCAAAYDTTTRKPTEVQSVPYVFTSDYVGSPDLGFARAVDYEAVLGRANAADSTLRAAAAVSGAAVSQAVGAVQMASLSQVIGFLNLRLGVWLPNPSYIASLRNQSSGLGARWLRIRRFTYLLKELTARYDLTDRFVYVTDGGQFENLGLYQLLARQCTTIYAFDASGDSPGRVTSLLESMDLARLRLGVEFTRVDDSTAIDPSDWQSVLFHEITGETAVTTAAWASFGVLYPDGTHGVIRFGKARLWTGLDDEKISNWTAVDEKFPSDSTIDQFLDPTQFAAYVRLGELVADHVLGPV